MDGTRLQESNVSNVSILKNAFGIMKKSDVDRENAWRYSYKTKQSRDALKVMRFWCFVPQGGE